MNKSSPERGLIHDNSIVHVAGGNFSRMLTAPDFKHQQVLRCRNRKSVTIS